MRCRWFVWTMCALVLLSVTGESIAETKVLSGYLRLRPALQSVRDNTPNNPAAVLFDTSSRYAEIFGLLRLNIAYHKAKLFSQVRPRCQMENGRVKCNIYVDEGYLDVGVTPSTFVYGGRRNVVDGAAHVANPTDFFGENRKLDQTLDETERRELRKGVYLAGVQHFFDNGTAVSASVASRVKGLQEQDTRLRFKLALLYPEIDTDMEVIGLATGERPGVGVNVSHTLNDSMVLYTESALRRGRDRSIVITDVSNNRIVDGNQDKYYFNGIAGGHYTFDNGVNLILEYLYNENGYSSGEWRAVQSFFQSNTQAITTPAVAQAIGNLGQGNQKIIGNDLLRRQYIFSRVNHPQWWGDTDSSLILLQNLEDGSRLLRGRVEKDLTDRIRAGIMAEYMTGGSWDEFGLRPWRRAVIADLKIFF
uniref:Alginate export n=1 Tax=Candidatus Kentrum sp. FM TaxID=2126340 RepID=A0A450S2P3_9GAMM|nr:MAG: hypothetical protein BECKFM1743A_GA0114220_100306 [Candidatus Kentron sp. FM]VFJ46019.1 MAG: hypothetical protein BECKFM1743C_GA0114222_100336 [Candidatus Kentron sp. FM]VFK07048.1 MAG: hypothetical protein BECKFM1743B_GA0114221_100306 [Candidatus Kentron sp. FM]